MIWKKITIETTNEAADIVASVLFDNGIIGVEIDDTIELTKNEIEKMYVDIPINRINDGISKVNFYISITNKKIVKNDNVDKNIVDDSYINCKDNLFTIEEFEEVFNNIKNGLEEYKLFTDMGTLKITEENLNDKDFLNKWKDNFKRITVDNINIIPSFDKGDINDSDINIIIEPGNAFGTGQHETTLLCLKILKEIVDSKMMVLDIGCGSGILSIFSLILGAKNVVGIDIDNNVENNLIDNINLNKISRYNKITDSIDLNSDFNFGFGNIFTDDEFKSKIFSNNYDIIVANILSPVIISIINNLEISKYINNNGYFVCSGIIKEKLELVENAINNDKNLKVIKTLKDGDWVAILVKKV